MQLYSKETPTLVLSCEYCQIFKNSFFYRTSSVAALFIEFFIQLWFSASKPYNSGFLSNIVRSTVSKAYERSIAHPVFTGYYQKFQIHGFF